jgi:TonB family protein
MNIALIRAAALLSMTVLVSSLAMAQQPAQSADNDRCAVQVFKGNEVDHKLKILAKPEPEFSREDHRKYPSAVIILQAVFCGSGKVTDIKVKSGVSDALDEKAIDAARRIQFIPAEKDGQKVSQVLTVEYRLYRYNR